MASLDQLVARVRFFIDEPVPANFSNSDIIYAINQAQQEVAKEIVHEYEDYFEKIADLNPNLDGSGNPIPFTGGTVPGTDLYTLPSDFLKFKRIERSDTGELIPAYDLNEKAAKVTVTSSYNGYTPIGYYVTGNSVGFTPVPTSIIPIRMYYVYRPVDLSDINLGTTDISVLPAEHHDIMAVRAAIDMFMKDESDTKALEDRYNQMLDALRRTLRQRQVQDPKRVRRVDDALGILW